MKPVKQTIVSEVNGNCLQAAIASLFELELVDVPHFLDYGDDWWFRLQDWFNERNLQVVWTAQFIPLGTYHIASVMSPRFEGATHAVVCDPDGNIIHDPHPDNDSLSAKPIGWYWFVVKDPAK